MTAGPADRTDNYEPFFGLREPPFSLAPNPRFRFASASHASALAQMAAAIERREPLVVVIGEIGTGKTLLCRTMLQELPRKTFLSVVGDPLLDRDDLLKQLLEDFGVISKDRAKLTPTTRHELVEALLAFLHSLASIGAHAVVIVDEAQHLQPEVLEQIRLLSNVDDEHGALLQVMLVGQTDLEPLLSRPELRQLSQRVSRRVRLEPLAGDEVQQYIEHRLALVRDEHASLIGAAELAQALAEWSGTSAAPTGLVEFTPDAIRAVARLSSGLPRVVNLLCDRALAEAYHARLRTIDVPLVDAAASALGLQIVPAPVTISESDLPVNSPAPDGQPDKDPMPAGGGPRARSAAFRSVRYVALAASLAVAAGAIWLGVRATRTSAPGGRSSAAAATSTPTPAPTTRSDTSALPTRLPTPQSPVAGETHPTPAAAAAPVADAPLATAARFDIVVASFRTDARASAVEAAVTALALPVRRRVSDGWQQVIAGPFASRAAVEAARARLDRAGLTGTQIVPIEP